MKAIAASRVIDFDKHLFCFYRHPAVIIHELDMYTSGFQDEINNASRLGNSWRTNEAVNQVHVSTRREKINSAGWFGRSVLYPQYKATKVALAEFEKLENEARSHADHFFATLKDLTNKYDIAMRFRKAFEVIVENHPLPGNLTIETLIEALKLINEPMYRGIGGRNFYNSFYPVLNKVQLETNTNIDPDHPEDYLIATFKIAEMNREINDVLRGDI